MNSINSFNNFSPLLQLEMYKDNNENLNFDIKFCLREQFSSTETLVTYYT